MYPLACPSVVCPCLSIVCPSGQTNTDRRGLSKIKKFFFINRRTIFIFITNKKFRHMCKLQKNTFNLSLHSQASSKNKMKLDFPLLTKAKKDTLFFNDKNYSKLNYLNRYYIHYNKNVCFDLIYKQNFFTLHRAA